MKKLVLCGALMLAVAGSAFAANPQKPGKWNVKMQMEIPGMPFKMPPINVDVCLTEEDLEAFRVPREGGAAPGGEAMPPLPIPLPLPKPPGDEQPATAPGLAPIVPGGPVTPVKPPPIKPPKG